MSRLFLASTVATLAGLCFFALSGCRLHQGTPLPTPAAVGYNSRDLIEPIAQDDTDELALTTELAAIAERLRKERQVKLAEQSKREGGASSTRPNRNILCLSGGGSVGAYSAGVLVGWTERGDRPSFDVVTGISTGALLAVPAFLGPRYDAQMTQFYTTVRSEDLFKVRPLRGLFGEAFADTKPLASHIDAFLTAEVMQDLAEAHRQGRRLYIGTTEQEGRQFIVWDIGAIAERNGPCDRALIAKVLLGSSAAPGLFPAAQIPVTVDGAPLIERHVDGGVSKSLFFRPPYIPQAERSNVAARDLGGAKVYVIVAGKLYADPEVIRPWSLAQASKNVTTLTYAQTRGDLQRLYTVCLLMGMDYNVAAISPEYAGTVSGTEFQPPVMRELFEEGRRQISSSKPWRTIPPGYGAGEGELTRAATELTHRPRGPLLPINGPRGTRIAPRVPLMGPETPAEQR